MPNKNPGVDLEKVPSPETFQRVLGASGEAMEVVLTADNNHTLLGTLVLENAHVVPDQPLPTTAPPREYDDKGATMYAVAVILVYGFSIVMLIASHTYMKRKRKRDGDDMSTVNKYLEQVPKLQELSKRDSFRRLKMSIIPLASIAIGRDIPTIKPDPGSPLVVRPGKLDSKSVRFELRRDLPSPVIHAGVCQTDREMKLKMSGEGSLGMGRAGEAGRRPPTTPLDDLPEGTPRYTRLLSTPGGASRLSEDTEVPPCSPTTTSLPSRGHPLSTGGVCRDPQASPPSGSMWLENELASQGPVTPHSGERAQRDRYLQQAIAPPVGHGPKPLTGGEPRGRWRWPVPAGEAEVAQPSVRHSSPAVQAPGVPATGATITQEEQQGEDEFNPLQITTV